MWGCRISFQVHFQRQFTRIDFKVISTWNINCSNKITLRHFIMKWKIIDSHLFLIIYSSLQFQSWEVELKTHYCHKTVANCHFFYLLRIQFFRFFFAPILPLNLMTLQISWMDVWKWTCLYKNGYPYCDLQIPVKFNSKLLTCIDLFHTNHDYLWNIPLTCVCTVQ